MHWIGWIISGCIVCFAATQTRATWVDPMAPGWRELYWLGGFWLLKGVWGWLHSNAKKAKEQPPKVG